MTDRKWHTGAEPTREDVLQELGRILAERRNVTKPDYDRIDRLQYAYDVIQALPPTPRAA